jgi:membrane protein insertase Oxa1/YidC/SpoIIIJ
MLENRKLAKALPELNFLVQLFRERLSSTSSSNDGSSQSRGDEILNTFSVFKKGARACFTLHDVSMTRIILPPVLNISMFITFVIGVRGMIRGGDFTDMDTGGILWFENLTVADPTYALPLIAVGSSYSALEFGFTNPEERLNDPNKGGRLSITIKDVFQTILLMSVPFVTQLPAGIFAYWIPSSIAGMAQTSGTRWLTNKERQEEVGEARRKKKIADAPRKESGEGQAQGQE